MRKSLLLTSALVATGMLSAADQDSALSFKLRAQAGLETVDGVRNGFGAGLNYAFKIGGGSINTELGYQYFSGKQFRQPIPTNTLGLTEENSVDSRKDSLAGLSFRLSYSMPINKAWSWQAGAAISNLKNHHESIALFATTPVSNWDTTTDKSNMTFSPFAGVRYDMNEIGAIEINVIVASYKTTTITPVLGTTTVTPAIGEKSVSKPKIEFGYVFKF